MSRKVNRQGGTPALRALTAAAIPYDALPYEHDEGVIAYGDEAAQKLGLDAAAVFKTLLIRVDTGEFGLILIPVSQQADLKAAAAGFGGKKAVLASPADVQRLTGYVLGGVSPLGTRTRLPTLIDDSARYLQVIYVSGGRRGLDVGLAPGDLKSLTQARWLPMAR